MGPNLLPDNNLLTWHHSPHTSDSLTWNQPTTNISCDSLELVLQWPFLKFVTTCSYYSAYCARSITPAALVKHLQIFQGKEAVCGLV